MYICILATEGTLKGGVRFDPTPFLKLGSDYLISALKWPDSQRMGGVGAFGMEMSIRCDIYNLSRMPYKVSRGRPNYFHYHK